MKTGRIAATLFAVAALGFVVGGAMAMVASPGAVPTTPPRPAVVTYTIASPGMGAPTTFTPFFASTGIGPTEIKLVSADAYLHLYMVPQLGLMVNVPAHATVTLLVYFGHPGQFAWINELPTPGSPAGMAVGFLTVT
ncbi:MAG: hypothetical protein L3J91_04965 [Thermoplasmata archaeon]|nr:hypothetical protein [Thermoplasmata archaeon]